MPKRRLPRTDAERDEALRNGKNRKDAVPPPALIPYTAATIARIDIVQPEYRAQYLVVSAAKNAQTGLTASVRQAFKMAVFYEQDFIDALNKAIRREEIPASARAFYQLNVNDETLPKITTESELTTWGQNIIDGEAARIAAGGAPITFPSVAQVTAKVTAFNTQNQLQANAKYTYDVALEALAAMNPDADKLILKMWNETETAFDEGNKPSMRNKCREWGVVYVPSPGETPSPDDYSMMGTITDSATGNPINEASVIIDDTPVLVQTDEGGKYFIPVQTPGTYNVTVYKGGYELKNITNVTIAAGAITTLNAALQPVGSVGSVNVTVFRAALPQAGVQVSVDGIPGFFNTNAEGKYTFNNIPPGTQTIRAEITVGAAQVQTISVIVVGGSAVDVVFNF
jgi:hypothetical protein